MRQKVLTFLIAALGVLNVCADDIAGTWRGKLKVGAQSLNLVFHFDKEKAEMDSPDQGAMGIKAEITFVSADSVALSVPSIGASYAGKLRDDKIIGVFKQMGMAFNLVLEKGELTRNRPQTPQPPFPYVTEEITFQGGASDVRLAATLTYPVGYDSNKCVPVAVLVSGSGLQNRDEEIFSHRPFLVIADYLARHGIATLRYDDRGTAQSTGNVADATTADFARDASAALDTLKKMRCFSSVGIIGHSEGGQIAFILGAKDKPDFIVTLAAPGLKGDSVIVEQNRFAMREAGIADKLDVKTWRNIAESNPMNAWLQHFIDYDPADDIAKTRCPVLALNGEKDSQVNATSNLSTIKRLLPKRKQNVTKCYAGLNHLFQHCKTGSTSEYANIEETFAEEALADITTWILNLK